MVAGRATATAALQSITRKAARLYHLHLNTRRRQHESCPEHSAQLRHSHPHEQVSFGQIVSNPLEPRNRCIIKSAENANTTVSETRLVIRLIAVVVQPRSLRHFVLPQLSYQIDATFVMVLTATDPRQDSR